MGFLTRPGWLVTGLSIVAVAAARTLAVPEFYLLGAVGLAMTAMAVVSVARPRRPLAIHRAVHPPRVHVGEVSRLTLEVSNPTRRRTMIMTLHDPVTRSGPAVLAMAPLSPGESRRATYRLPTRHRGVVRVGPLSGVRSDPFGLASRTEELADVVEITVLPVVEPLGSSVGGSGLVDDFNGLSRSRWGPMGGDEFSSLREYVEGDDLRRIHWPSTARTGSLLVRQDDPPWRGRLTVVLDTRAGRLAGPAFETAVSAAASLLSAAADRGEQCRLLMTDGTDSGPSDGPADMESILNRLARVEPGPDGVLPRVGDGLFGGDTVVVTGPIDQSNLGELAGLTTRGSLLWVVEVADTAATRAVMTPPGSAFGSNSHTEPSVQFVRLEAGHPVGPALSAAFAAGAVR